MRDIAVSLVEKIRRTRVRKKQEGDLRARETRNGNEENFDRSRLTVKYSAGGLGLSVYTQWKTKIAGSENAASVLAVDRIG